MSGGVIKSVLSAAAVAVALVACSGSDDPMSDVGGDPDTVETSGPSSGASAAPEILEFSAPLLGGGDIDMIALAGRPVLLWFWAPW